MTSYVLSPEAIRDLEEIEAYVAADRPTAVDGLLDAIEAACDLVAEFPDAGRARDEVAERVRSFPVGQYLLFYVVDGRAVCISRILHARRDIAMEW